MATSLRAVEFYSGLGGMHYALKSCGGIYVNVVAAIDINTTANDVYAYNFSNTTLLNRNIEGIKLEEFIKFNADIFTMSPPCQPFTRQGNQKASNDPRTKSFLHIMKIIRSLPKPPSYILMENVKGFELSETREEFIETLREANYTFQEFLLSPSQFGVPNSRLRYFLLAVHKPLKLPFPENGSIMENLPSLLDSSTNSGQCSNLITDNPRLHCPVCSKTQMEESNSPGVLSNTTTNDTEQYFSQEQKDELPCNRVEFKASTDRNTCSSLENTGCEKAREGMSEVKNESTMKVVSDVSEKNSTEGSKIDLHFNGNLVRIRNKIKDHLEEGRKGFEEFLLPESVLKRKVLLMDIVQASCNHSCCFTKGYGHYVEGTGSVLQMSSIDSSLTFKKYDEVNESEKIKLLTPLGLRYFTPREIANLLCFPQYFDFPETVTMKQKYRLLGNSLNVLVVAELMKILFSSN